MKEKIRLKMIWVVLLMLPLFLLLSISYAQQSQNAQITATVSLLPNATIKSEPNTLVRGSSLRWIICFIELDGANVIDINSANLSVLGLPDSLMPNPLSFNSSFKIIGDFNKNGIPDLQVQFNRTLADQLWFNSAPIPKTFNLIISGTVLSFPFSGSDTITVVKIPAKQFSRYVQISSADGGKLDKIETINLSSYTASSISFSGYFVNQGDSKIFGVNTFYSQGTLAVSRRVNLRLFSFSFIERQPITIAASMTQYDNCFGNNVTFDVSCYGSGILLIHNGDTQENSKIELNVMRFEVKNSKAKVEGGDFWNDKLSVENIPITSIKII